MAGGDRRYELRRSKGSALVEDLDEAEHDRRCLPRIHGRHQATPAAVREIQGERHTAVADRILEARCERDEEDGGQQPAPPEVHICRRPSSACESVTSSAYSRSPPTGRPLARRVTVTPTGLSIAATYIAVALPSRFGLVARITSVTWSRSTRSSSSWTRRSSGPMPSSGLIAPPSTWYRPLITPAFSIVATSFGSSTTQRVVRSRPSSRQIRHRSPSATLPHSLQKKMRSFACRIDSARRFASSGGALTRWNANRWADLGPMPGSRDSSSIRSWIGPSYT